MPAPPERPAADGLDPLGLAALDHRPGPARILPRCQADALIAGALDRHFARGALVRRRGRRVRLALVAALTLGAVSAAAAVAYVTYRATRAVEEPDPSSALPRRRPRRARRVVAPAPLPDVGRGDGVAVADASVPEASVPDAAVVVRHRPARRARAADDLLSRANRRRAARGWRAAERLYQQVRRRYPRTDQAYAATVAAAALRLEHLGDPAGALGLYRRAGADRRRHLREEVLFGLASCYRRLGRRAAEARALAAAIAAYPRSPMRRRAERRLGEIGGAR